MHATLAVYLTVYSDDFKMSGRRADVAKAWALIQEVIQLETPTEQGRYGLPVRRWHQRSCASEGTMIRAPWHRGLDGDTASCTRESYDVSDFVGQCVAS